MLATRDKPLLLEKICCALASEQINILSADLFTRTDGIVVNIFRVCTTNFEPVSDASTRKRFLATFEDILAAENYEPERYLRRRVNFLKPRTDHDIPVPVRAYVSNELHPTCTTVELQALDRIGLLHDLFHTINQYGLNTAHARICTEKGVAMDTLYITTADGGKVEDPEILRQLEERFTTLIARPENAQYPRMHRRRDGNLHPLYTVPRTPARSRPAPKLRIRTNSNFIKILLGNPPVDLPISAPARHPGELT